MVKMDTDYCQSWWLNPIGLSTSQINYRAKLLVQRGYLTIDKSQTSTSMGISYKLIYTLQIYLDVFLSDMKFRARVKVAI